MRRTHLVESFYLVLTTFTDLGAIPGQSKMAVRTFNEIGINKDIANMITNRALQFNHKKLSEDRFNLLKLFQGTPNHKIPIDDLLSHYIDRGFPIYCNIGNPRPGDMFISRKRMMSTIKKDYRHINDFKEIFRGYGILLGLSKKLSL